MLYKITKDDDNMEFFTGTSTPTRRLGFIEYFAGGQQLDPLILTISVI